MGMDIHGLRPKEKISISEFPIYAKMKKLEMKGENGWKEKWELLDKDRELQEKYWKEEDLYQSINKGIYFRNNCWWWRPLWNYCYSIADDLISEELYESGHHNSGDGLDGYNAQRLGQRLLEEIEKGNTKAYQTNYQQMIEDLDDKDFNKSYPFDVDNVKRFAEFCLESGGFEIC